MRIYEVVNYASHVKKDFCTIVTTKVTHCLCPIFYVAVVSFYRVVVMLQSVFLACDRHTESRRACSVEKFVERVLVVAKLV